MAALCAGAVGLSACTSTSATAPPTSQVSQGGSGSPTTAVRLSEPDTNGDGKVIVGILSPGDINDHGYYQSFVDAADRIAKQHGWQVIVRGSLPVNQALQAARALCEQHVDLIALGASELKDAITASTEPECQSTAWYVPTSGDVAQTPRIFLSTDDPNQTLLAAGFAAGQLMKPRGYHKAGFITGFKADFSVLAAKAFLAGIREVIPSATVVSTYTGDFDDSAKAKEATQAQLSQGVRAIYPYLGGGTDASAQAADAARAITLTPGTDRCGGTPKFDISVIFSPGDYLTLALREFAAGNLPMGTEKVWHMGKDAYPTIKMCTGTPAQKSAVATFVSEIGTGKIDAAAEVRRLGG